MRRKVFNQLMIKVCKKNGWDIPEPEDLDFTWAVIGIIGRMGCPEKFQEALDEDDELLGCLLQESESCLN